MRSRWLCLRLLTDSGPLKNATVEVFVRLNNELALEHEDLLIGVRLPVAERATQIGQCQRSIGHELTESCRKESKMIDSALWLVRPSSILTVEPQSLTIAR